MVAFIFFYVCNQNPKNRKCCCDYRHEKMTNCIVRFFFKLKLFLTKHESFIILKVFKVKALSVFDFVCFSGCHFTKSGFSQQKIGKFFFLTPDFNQLQRDSMKNQYFKQRQFFHLFLGFSDAVLVVLTIWSVMKH